MSRDPQILKDDLKISERRLTRYHYEMQVVKYLEKELANIKKIISILDTNCNVCIRNSGEIIKNRYIRVRAFWDSVSDWYKEWYGKVPRDIVNPFRDTADYLAEAISTSCVYDKDLFNLLVPSTEFLFLLENS